jgi:NADPH:quinone reductase-like Zn-dependent oxidoreductase
LVKSIGADKVIDYTKEDFTKSGEKYDIIFDAVGKTTFSQCKNLLDQKGKYLQAGITLNIFPFVFLTSIFGSKKALIMATGLRSPVERTKDLKFIGDLLEAEKIKPVIDKVYPIEQISDAHRLVDTGHKKGNVVIAVESNA